MVPRLNFILILFSAISFAGFGAACVFAPEMKREFLRYGLSKWRPLIGLLQLSAAGGLLLGLMLPWIGQAAAAGLALMMLTGVCVRIRIKDTVIQTVPAFFYFALNAYLCVAAF